MIRRGADVNQRTNCPPLVAAGLQGKKEVVQVLLKHGADPFLVWENPSSHRKEPVWQTIRAYTYQKFFWVDQVDTWLLVKRRMGNYKFSPLEL